MKTKINIADILGPDLKSRSVARDFNLYIHNLNEPDIIVDFSNIKFATRSFIDEFYNIFIKPGANTINVELENTPPDLQAVFDAVRLTQNRPKSKDNTGSVVFLNSIDEVKKFFKTIAL